MNRQPFAALIEAVEAVLRDDGAALHRALTSSPDRALLHVVVRHKCEALLLHGMSRLGVRDRALAELLGHLRAHCRVAALQNAGIEEQLRAIVRALDEGGVAFVLLKGAARVHRGERYATSSPLYDLDVLVSPADASRAVDALLRLGYVQPYGRKEIARYARLHHHLAPLLHAQRGKSVELHTALSPPNALSTNTTWNAVAPYAQTCDGTAGSASCFDAFGTGLHYVVHGVGINRLFDVALLAQLLRSDPSLHQQLSRAIAAERVQPIALAAPLALATRWTHAAHADERMQRYLNWVVRRESLSDSIRDRAQFAEAWHANDGHVLGPATLRAFPAYESDNRLRDALRFPFQTMTRILASVTLPIAERLSA